MKKISLVILMIMVLSLLLACTKEESTPPKAEQEPQITGTDKASDSVPKEDPMVPAPGADESEEDCFIWEGDWIIGLTDKGKNEKILVIPQRATFMGEFLGSYEDDEIKVAEIRFSNPNIQLDEYAFYYSTIEIVFLPLNMTNIPDNFFLNCKRLKKVVIPDSVTAIGDTAFAFSETLEEVEGGKNVEVIKYSAFSGCVNLKSFEFGDKLQTIGDQAFMEWNSLTKLNLPPTLESIGNFAFMNCLGLEEVVIAEGTKKIGVLAFAGNPELKVVQLPESLEEIGSGAFENEHPITFRVKEGSLADLEFDNYVLPGIENDKVYY